MNQKYETKAQIENLAGIELKVETLADLDHAIDKLCEGVDESKATSVFAENLCPYFGVIWPAARAASEHVARIGGWIKGKSVLEVGCGLALPSLVAAKLGAKVTATDFHPDVPEFLSRNMELNSITREMLDYRVVDWRTQSETLGTFDFIVGSDILYEAHHPETLAKALKALCGKQTQIIIADPGRVYLQPFVNQMTKLGFRHDMFVKEVKDKHSDRAGDKSTKEVFVVAFS